MGRIFLDHIGGTRLFSCANCDTILTNRSELISTRFTGATGRAFLFNKVGGKTSSFPRWFQWLYFDSSTRILFRALELARRVRMRAAVYREDCPLVCLGGTIGRHYWNVIFNLGSLKSMLK